MREAVGAAEAAFEEMRRLPAHVRMEILSRASEGISARHEELARTIAREGVKTIREARKEATRAAETFRISAEEARRVSGETVRFDQRAGSENRTGYFVREPTGVVGAITPFNDPLNLVAHKIGPALAAGNAVVVKPHPATPLSALRLAEVVEEAGAPPGSVQVVTGVGDAGEALATDPRVRMLSFTGGRNTAAEIVRKIGIKRVSLELGSNSPVIVLPDADLGRALEATVSGAFWAAGQNCLHVQRLFVHEDVYRSFKDRFVDAARAYRTGDKQDEATDMGPLIDEAAALRVTGMIEEAIEAGGSLLTGGKRRGSFLDPTVVEVLDDRPAVMREEVFGPLTALSPIGSLDEGIERANSVDYGLHAAIFTRDLKSAFRAVSELRCGGVVVNDSTDYRIDAMPFGGIKGSGIGREGVRFAIEEMTETKVVCFAL
jgi:glyceraldehyde-3-phosphate dehydrogenase (NADP+)